jgi:predicted transcriptional regulator
MIIPRCIVNDIGPIFNKLMAEGIFKCRMLQEVRVALYIFDDKQAGIMFPDAHGEVDIRTLFTSKNSEFCTWCLDLFKYFHNRSKPFDLSKMRVAD